MCTGITYKDELLFSPTTVVRNFPFDGGGGLSESQVSWGNDKLAFAPFSNVIFTVVISLEQNFDSGKAYILLLTEVQDLEATLGSAENSFHLLLHSQFIQSS